MALSTLLFGNPTAQSGKAAAHLERAVKGLESRGASVLLIPTEPEGRTVGVVTAAIAEHTPDVVLYLGGDGTFNEVARGMLSAEHPTALGMLPMGTANDQGRSFGLRPGPGAIEDNLDIVMAGHLTQLDVGEVEALDEDGKVFARTRFFDCVGWGMQPEILAQRNADRAAVGKIPILREIYRDQAVYAGAAIDRYIASFIEPTKFDAVIVSGGERHVYEGLTDVVINNTALYAGEWVPDRFAEPDDGLMELVPMQGRRDWASKAMRDLAILPLFQEDLDVFGVTHSEGFSGADFDLTFERPERALIPGQLDGEEWIEGTHFRVRVLKNALPLITPADFEPPWRFEPS